jgi:5-methylcytosine-specific restriction endonuclease McrA
MATKPPTFTRPGTPKTRAEYRLAYDRTRPNAADRGYDGTWNAFRANYLRSHPTCSVLGCTSPATEIHHLKRIKDRPDLRLDLANLTALCRHHHSRITTLEDGWARGKRT